jgi:clan AA aspartic protease (TIGR02281 family)
MKTLSGILLLFLYSLSINATERIFKCKNEQDKTVYQKTECTNNAQTLSTWIPKENKNSSLAEIAKKMEILVKQGIDGHFYLKAEINSTPIMFLIDTGATTVSIPNDFAVANNLFCGDNIKAITAGGVTNGCEIVIAELRLDDFTFKNVRAVIIQNLSEPLLGMNVLHNFDISQKNGEMRLIERGD